MFLPMSAVTCKLNRILLLATGLTVLLGLALSLVWASPAYAGERGSSAAAENFIASAPLPLHSPALLPLASPSLITATKSYTLATDSDGDTQADPGDVLSYTIVITNNTVTTNTGLIISDTLDPNLSQLGLVSISPIAFDDSFNTITNPLTLSVPDGPTDLFADDFPGLNPAVTGIATFGGGSLGGSVTTNLAGSTVPIASGGSLTLNANGSFSFTPAVGFQGVFTTFYRLQNFVGPGDGLVSFIVDAAPRISSTSPISAATLVNATTNITLTFTENVDIAAGGITLTCDASPVSFSPALPQNGVSALVLDPSVNLPGNAICTVTILAANTSDTDTNDPPNNLDGNNDGVEGDNYVFSFQIAPTANDDSYNVTPHLTLNSTGTATTSVRANDDPTTVTITGFGFSPSCTGTTPGNQLDAGAANGRLSLNLDGTFTYEPPAGVSNTTRTFCYTIIGGDTANIVFNLQNTELVWFVDAAAAAGGVGNQARPFQTLTAAAAVDTAGDTIFVSYNAAGYSCGVSLLANERLIGEGSGSTLAALSGVTPVAGSTLPALTNNSANWPNLTASSNCVTLNTNNTLRGFNFGNVGAANTVITGTNFSTLTVNDASIATNGRALQLNNGTAAATFSSISSAGSSAEGVRLDSLAGSFTVSTLTVINSAGIGIDMVNDTGSFNLGVVNINNTTGSAAFSVRGATPTVQATSVTITNSSSRGLVVQSLAAAGSVTISSVTISASAQEGIFSFNNAAPITINGGSLQTSGGGAEFYVSGGTGNITYAGTITDVSADPVVYVENSSGGTKTFSGAISGGGIGLANNTGATINFSGGVTLSTGSSDGFNASGGGTVNVTGPNNIITTTDGIALNVVNTTIGASGLTFRSISSNGAPSGIVLNNTGSSGGLTVTGNSAGLCGGGVSSATPPATIVAPVIADCTGGPILASTNAGVVLINTSNVSLTRMRIANGADDGIRGDRVNGFTLASSLVESNGPVVSPTFFNNLDFGDDRNGGYASGFVGLTGPANITNSTIRNGSNNNILIRSRDLGGGTLNLTMTGSVISGNPANAFMNDGVLMESGELANMNATITGNIFTASKGDHFQMAALNSGDANVNFTNNTLTGGHSTALGQGITINAATGVAFGGGYSGRVDYDINGNNINGSILSAITVNLGTSGATAVFDGFVRNNIIGTSGSALSCSTQAHGIAVDAHGNGTHTVAVTDNTIRRCADRGMGVLANDGNGNLNLTVTGNTVTEMLDDNAPNGTPREAIELNLGATSTNVFGQIDSHVVCLALGGTGAQRNSLTGGTFRNGDIRLRQRFRTRVVLPGYTPPGGNNFDTASVIIFLQGNNLPVGVTATATTNNDATFTGEGYFGGAACVLPSP